MPSDNVGLHYCLQYVPLPPINQSISHAPNVGGCFDKNVKCSITAFRRKPARTNENTLANHALKLICHALTCMSAYGRACKTAAGVNPVFQNWVDSRVGFTTQSPSIGKDRIPEFAARYYIHITKRCLIIMPISVWVFLSPCGLGPRHGSDCRCRLAAKHGRAERGLGRFPVISSKTFLPGSCSVPRSTQALGVY